MPVIQALWIGGKLSKLEQLCIASFLNNGHPFHLYTYENVKGVPKGAQLKDANEIIQESKIFTTHGGSYAHFADWFRWELLFQKGNFWVDMDIICLKPFLFNEDLVFAYEGESRKLVGASVLGIPAGHKVSRYMADKCESPHKLSHMIRRSGVLKGTVRKAFRMLVKKKRSDISWGEGGGPAGFTDVVKQFDMSHLAKPPNCFYPVRPGDFMSIFDDTSSGYLEILLENSYAIHLWNERLRRFGYDKNANFSKHSLLEKLKKIHL